MATLWGWDGKISIKKAKTCILNSFLIIIPIWLIFTCLFGTFICYFRLFPLRSCEIDVVGAEGRVMHLTGFDRFLSQGSGAEWAPRTVETYWSQSEPESLSPLCSQPSLSDMQFIRTLFHRGDSEGNHRKNMFAAGIKLPANGTVSTCHLVVCCTSVLIVCLHVQVQL